MSRKSAAEGAAGKMRARINTFETVLNVDQLLVRPEIHTSLYCSIFFFRLGGKQDTIFERVCANCSMSALNCLTSTSELSVNPFQSFILYS